MIHRAYNSTKDIEKKTCACSRCGATVSWSGSNCVGFGLYMCASCRISASALSDRRVKGFGG